jgi:hypothetical protein
VTLSCKKHTLLSENKNACMPKQGGDCKHHGKPAGPVISAAGWGRERSSASADVKASPGEGGATAVVRAGRWRRRAAMMPRRLVFWISASDWSGWPVIGWVLPPPPPQQRTCSLISKWAEEDNCWRVSFGRTAGVGAGGGHRKTKNKSTVETGSEAGRKE